MNFTPIAWLDPFEVGASLRERLHLFPEADADGSRVLDLRWFADDKWKAHWQTKAWVELNNMLSRIKRFGAPHGLEPGKIALQMLEPGALLPWAQTPVTSLVYPIRTNPAVRHICGLEMQYLQPGSLTLVAPSQMTSAANLGETFSCHLVIEVRKQNEP